jgi:hypothetical protein
VIGDQITDGATLPDRLRAVDPRVGILGAILEVLAPAVEQFQADRDLWLMRMRVITNNPTLLPTLFARGMTAEKEFVAALEALAVVKDVHGTATSDLFLVAAPIAALAVIAVLFVKERSLSNLTGDERRAQEAEQV